MYFKEFPRIVYPLTDEFGVDRSYTLTDITTRIKFDMPEEDIERMTTGYVVKDRETPESVSYKVYGSVRFYWAIMFVNNMYDYAKDWIMSDERLQEYCRDKYGPDFMQKTLIVDSYNNVIGNANASMKTFMTFLDTSGETLPIEYDGTISEISPYEYESLLNEKKRVIRIIKPEMINRFTEKYRIKLGEAVI